MRESIEKGYQPNDYVSRLELWDTHAIEVGQSKPLAVATWIEHEIERQAFARQLQYDGIEGVSFNDFLLRQLSWPQKEDAPPLSMKATRQKWEEMPAERKKNILNAILEKLKMPVSLCVYELTSSGSCIHSIGADGFSKEDIQSGLGIYLRSFAPDLVCQEAKADSESD